MAFLDKKQRILDICLTDRGRELLSENQLAFRYYAFSDDGINYTGSFSSSAQTSGTIDNYVYNTFTFEANQKNDKTGNLNYFLYTIQEGAPTLPRMSVGITTGSDVVLERQFYIEEFTIEKNPQFFTLVNGKAVPLAVVLRADVAKNDQNSRKTSFVEDQKASFFRKLFMSASK